MGPTKLTSFSLDQQPPVPIDWEDLKALKLSDTESHNLSSVYNYPSNKSMHQELYQSKVKTSGTLPINLEGIYLRNSINIQF